MAQLTIDAHDKRLLERALKKRITLTGRVGVHQYTVSSGSGGSDYLLVANPSGRVFCNCTAGSNGRRCSHAAYLTAFLAWERAQGDGR